MLSFKLHVRARSFSRAFSEIAVMVNSADFYFVYSVFVREAAILYADDTVT